MAIPQQIVSGLAAYCSPAELFAFIDPRVVAGLVLDDETADLPTAANMADTTNAAGALVASLLMAGSGEVEAACLPRGQYTPDDLLAIYQGVIVNNAPVKAAGSWHLVRVTAGCAIMAAFGRRHTASRTKADDYPAAAFAAAALERLRTGEHVFGLSANLAAGAGTQAVPFVSNDPADPNRTVNQAARFFGVRGPTCGGY